MLLRSGDSDKLTQLFYTLLQNALKNTSKGFVRVCGAVMEGELEIRVEDSGCGGELFERQGLAVCRKLVELHGGSISVDSDGQGSCFLVRLPCLQELPKAAERPLVLHVGERQLDALQGYEVVGVEEWLESKKALELVVFDLQASEELSRKARNGNDMTFNGIQ